LLRSGQREVGEILRQSLEAVLEFAVVMGELHRGRLKEYQAGPMVEDLFAKFRSKMMMLVSAHYFSGLRYTETLWVRREC